MKDIDTHFQSLLGMSKNENRPLTGSTSRFAATLDQPALGKFDFSFAKKKGPKWQMTITL